MAPEWIYLLKVNAGIALFYAFYKLFCQRDTFFLWRRFALLSFMGISFVYPLLNIQHWVKEQPAMYELADYYATFMMLEEVYVSPTTPHVEVPSLMTLCTTLYFAGILLLSLRFIIQLLSICRMRRMGKTVYLDGQRVISLSTEGNPFSFFGWIFVYLPTLKPDSQGEILMHEQTHARQWHSIDVIVSEIVNIICWFNPFMWLLKSEIRLNLEYLADNKVAETLCNCKQYQYHLLGLAHTNGQTGLYNNFNVSHIKRRIIMMNKKRTRTAGRIKYALFAPLAAALLLVSNIESVARTVEKVIDSGPLLTDRAEQDNPQQDVIYQVCEEQPVFPGGTGELIKFISKNIKYPAEAKAKKIEGRVIVQMIVEKDGSLSGIEIKRGVDPLLDQEAIRVVKSMPKWTPAKQKGKHVRVRYILPVAFSLQGGENTIQEHQVQFPNEDDVIKPDKNGIYQLVEEQANFPGGMSELMKWLQGNVQYPEACEKDKVEGRVIVAFVVNKDGSIKDAKILRNVHPLLDQEALRVVNLMPTWIPGKVKGEPVASRFIIPVMFKHQ